MCSFRAAVNRLICLVHPTRRDTQSVGPGTPAAGHDSSARGGMLETSCPQAYNAGHPRFSAENTDGRLLSGPRPVQPARERAPDRAGLYIFGSTLSESLLLPVAAASKGQLKGASHAHHGGFTFRPIARSPWGVYLPAAGATPSSGGCATCRGSRVTDGRVVGRPQIRLPKGWFGARRSRPSRPTRFGPLANRAIARDSPPFPSRLLRTPGGLRVPPLY
jgi:hypothetical protein